MRQEIDDYSVREEYEIDTAGVTGQWKQMPLNLSDAVMNVISAYGDAASRASRSELWWWVAFVSVFLPCVNILSRMIGVEVLWVFVAGLLVIPSLCAAIRRIHDAGYPAWWLLLAFTGIGVPVVVFMLLLPSEMATNRWGAVPNMLRTDY